MRPVSVEFGKRKKASEEDSNQRRADMATVYVKCKPGRRHYYEGRVIPTDKFVPVDGNDPLMQRAIYFWICSLVRLTARLAKLICNRASSLYSNISCATPAQWYRRR